MKTMYVIGSLDQNVWLESIAYPLPLGRYRGCFTPRERLACRYGSMTEAQLVLFNLESDDACAVGLNLIVIPVREGDNYHLDSQLSLPLDDQ
jgi:hypothetical protein